MAERMLIVKLVRKTATEAELFARKLKFPALKLFELAELAAVGIDVEKLPIGQEIPCRFWAYYEESAKKKASGRPYLDVISLEGISSPATVTSTDNSAILAELRAIRALLTVIAQGQGLAVPELPAAGDLDTGDGETENGNGDGQPGELAQGAQVGSELDRNFPRYGNGQAVGENPAEQEAYRSYLDAHQGQAPADLAALRSWTAAQRRGAGQAPRSQGKGGK